MHNLTPVGGTWKIPMETTRDLFWNRLELSAQAL